MAITTLGALLSAADLIVNVLPLPIVARLNVPLRQRVAATLLLSLGTIATAAGVVREVYIYRAFIGSKDSTWNALPLWICADVEIYIGLVSQFNISPTKTRTNSFRSSAPVFHLFAPPGPRFRRGSLAVRVPVPEFYPAEALIHENPLENCKCPTACHGTTSTKTSSSTAPLHSTRPHTCGAERRVIRPRSLRD